jgi:hypothetical protein
MLDISNIFFFRTFFRCIPSGDRNIYFAGLDRISISLSSPLFPMIPPYPNKEHAREDGKNGFKRGRERDHGPAFETEFLSLSTCSCPRPTRAAVRFPARNGHVEALVFWIEITFFPLLPAFFLFKTPTASLQADAIGFWNSADARAHTVLLELSWERCNAVVTVNCGPPLLDLPHHKQHSFICC